MLIWRFRGLRINVDDLAGFQSRKQGEHFGNQWHHVMELGAVGVQNDHGNLLLRPVLLKVEIAVARDQ